MLRLITNHPVRLAAIWVLGAGFAALSWAPPYYGDLNINLGDGYTLDSVLLNGIDPTSSALQNFGPSSEAVITNPDSTITDVTLTGSLQFSPDGGVNDLEQSLSGSGSITDGPAAGGVFQLSADTGVDFPVKSFFDVFTDIQFSGGGLTGSPTIDPLTATPEPFTIGLGIAGVGLFVRRRLRKPL